MQVILDTLEYGSAIKKTPVVVGNCTGFAVNRVFFPYTQAACLLVDMGLDPYKIDMAIFAGFGMPMGPFRWGAFHFMFTSYILSATSASGQPSLHQFAGIHSLFCSASHVKGGTWDGLLI